MAKLSDVTVFSEGVASWNTWRASTPTHAPDLSGLDFRQIASRWGMGSPDDPYDGYLEGIQLHRTDLSNSFLEDVCVRDADMSRADLRGAHLRGSTFIRVKFDAADFRGADLRGVTLVDSDLSDAMLDGANLDGATSDGKSLESSVAAFPKHVVRPERSEKNGVATQPIDSEEATDESSS